MTDDLNLVIGKPVLEDQEKNIKGNIATFTRFTLPFAFQLQAVTNVSEPPKLYYTVNEKSDLSFKKRRKYFTRETADTLYQRSQWLSVCDNWNQTQWGKTGFSVTLRDQDFKIAMLPPQLVLFETPDIEVHPKCNILQTGFLYVDVYFCEEQIRKPQLDDLLVLNEFFRYFGMPWDDHSKIFKGIFPQIPINLEGIKTIANADKLACYFERWASLLEIPIQIGNQYYRLFPESWATEARNWAYNKTDAATTANQQAEHWQIYADNRCYVWTTAFLKDGAQNLRDYFEPDKKTLAAADYGHWIKLLNVDCPPFADGKYKTPKETHATVTQFEKEWVAPRTYTRWEEDGTLYGFCYHAAAILARKEIYIFAPSATYYFDTTLLLLYVRMVLFRFSRALSEAMPETEKQDETQTRDHLRMLRRLFSRFTVLYRFPMLSNQQQHMELYEINRKFHDVDQYFDETQKEVDNLHEFMETVEANRLASAANRLATWGIPLAAGGLMAALFSMIDSNIWQCAFPDQICSLNFEWWTQAIVVMVVALAFSLPALTNWFKRKVLKK